MLWSSLSIGRNFYFWDSCLSCAYTVGVECVVFWLFWVHADAQKRRSIAFYVGSSIGLESVTDLVALWGVIKVFDYWSARK